ncbi:unnamed protein product, partial [Cladocopium goreaui]
GPCDVDEQKLDNCGTFIGKEDKERDRQMKSLVAALRREHESPIPWNHQPQLSDDEDDDEDATSATASDASPAEPTPLLPSTPEHPAPNVDTMVAADALHTDSQTDAIMDLLGDDFSDEDAAFLTQVTKRMALKLTCVQPAKMRCLILPWDPSLHPVCPMVQSPPLTRPVPKPPLNARYLTVNAMRHISRSASSSSLPMPHVSSDQTHGDHTEFMQRARRWQRPRQETLGSAAASTPAAPSAGTVQQSPNALPSVMLADMRDFRATLQWMVQQATDACLDTADAPVRIQTWFLDSNRRSRSEEPRSIVLRPLPHTWVPDIIARWRDEIDPHVILHLHVVQPMPSAGTDDIHAHVILVQNPNDLWRAALVSIVYFDQDPWNPAYVATMLDAETTIEQIAFRTHVVHPANPRAQHFQVEVRHASVTLDSRSPFHVRDGYHFELVVFDNSDPWADSVALIQMSFTSIKANMREHPVPIYLDACLPADDVATPQFQEDASTILWFANSNWKRTVAESLGNHLCTVPVDLYLPEPTCEGIMQSVCAPFDPHAHPIYEIYIDGATGSTHAGWAAVVVACTPDSRRLLGVTGGTVELSPSATQWVGADRPDNIAAELTALLAAHAIILQQDTVSQFCIRPDLSLSRIIAQELSTTKAHPRLAQLCRVVSCWNKAKAHYLEVRGHTQDPWNELADAVAKYCTQPNRSSAFAFSFAQLHALAIEAHDIAWDWLHYEQPALSACLPPCFDETVVQITACQPPQLLPVAAVADEDPPQAFHVKVMILDMLFPSSQKALVHANLDDSIALVRRYRPRKAFFVGMCHFREHHDMNRELRRLWHSEGLDVQVARDGHFEELEVL